MELKDTTICVYGASSSTLDAVYAREAYKLGELLGIEGASVICGGGRAGLMAAVTEGNIKGGGKVCGVLPQFMIDNNWQHPQLTEMVSTTTMHERKMLMASRSDAAIALPGGIGTFDELFEIITWRQLGLYNHPVVLLNTNNYFAPVAALIQHGIDNNFITPAVNKLFFVASRPEDAINYLREWNPSDENISSYKKSY